MKRVKLTKAVLLKMTPSESKMLNSLKDKHEKQVDLMVKKQSLYSQTARKNPNSKQLNKLMNDGFKAEFDAFKTKEKHDKYIEKLVEKYKI